MHRLPWEDTQAGRTPLVEQLLADQLIPAVLDALRCYGERGVDLEYARTHALRKLAEGNRVKTSGRGLVSYVARAFGEEYLTLPRRGNLLALPDPEPATKGSDRDTGASSKPGGTDAAREASSGAQKRSEGSSGGRADADGHEPAPSLVDPQTLADFVQQYSSDQQERRRSARRTARSGQRGEHGEHGTDRVQDGENDSGDQDGDSGGASQAG